MSPEHEPRPHSEGLWLFGNSENKQTGAHRFAGGESVVFTARRPEGDGENEDAVAIVERNESSGALIVADGFGGAPAGERASRLAVAEVAERVVASRADGAALRAAVLDGFESANRRILELGLGAATTMVAISLDAGSVRAFHCGDSAILVIGGRGKIKWQTVAHSPAGYAVASGWVDEHEARDHEEAQVVSNYLGSNEMRIEIGPKLRLAPRDTVVLASDGLTDNLSVEEIAEIVVTNGGLSAALATLATWARKRMGTEAGKPDDLTIVAYRSRRGR